MSMRSWIRDLFARPSTRPIRKAPRRARLSIEALEDRTVPSVSVLNNSGNGYAGMNFNQSSGGYVPPDTCGAAGPSAYVETVNQTLAIFNPKDTGAGSVTD